MAEDISKEKLIQLYEKSSNGILSAEQCVIWLPIVCDYAIELLQAKEERERVVETLQKVKEYRKMVQEKRRLKPKS